MPRLTDLDGRVVLVMRPDNVYIVREPFHDEYPGGSKAGAVLIPVSGTPHLPVQETPTEVARILGWD